MIPSMRKPSLYVKIVLLALGIILCSVVLISTVTYSIAVNNNFDNAKSYNRYILDQQKSLIDKELSAVRDLAVNMTMTQSYMFAKWGDDLAVGSLIDLTRYLEQQKSLYPYIESIYLYYADLQQVLTSSSTAQPLGEFADRSWLPYVEDRAEGGVQWVVNRVKGPEGQEAAGEAEPAPGPMLPAAPKLPAASMALSGPAASSAQAATAGRQGPPAVPVEPDAAGAVITHVQPIPLLGEPKGALIINLDRSLLFADALGDRNAAFGESLVLGADNRAVLPLTGGLSRAYVELAHVYQDGGGQAHVNIGGENTIESYAVSDVTDWKYVLLTPEKALLNQVENIKWVVLMVALFYIAAATLVALFLSRRIYRPLRTAIEHLKGWGKAPAAGEDEASYIQSAYEHMTSRHARLVEKKESIERVLQRNKSAFKEKYLLDWLRGYGFRHDREADVDYDAFLEVRPLGRFALLLIEIDEAGQWTARGDRMPLHLLRYRMAEEIGAMSGGEVLVKDEDQLVLVHELEKEATDAGAEAAQRIRSYAASAHGISVTIGVSAIHEGLPGLETAYREAERAVQQKIYVGKGEILLYAAIVAWDSGEAPYYYPYELEKQLIDRLKQGDRAGVPPILDGLVRVIRDKKLSETNIRHLFYQFSGEMIKSVTATGESIDVVLGGPTHGIEDISSVHTLQEMQAYLTRLAERIMTYYADKAARIHEETMERVIRFMEEHYNRNISLDAIAEHVQLSVSYVGRLFKDKTGRTLNEYLMDLKINAAKRLLISTDLVVEEICREVGYNTVSYFTKLFKSKTGYTPGGFRRMHHSEG
ncbi:helix-turn-helix domain-containing protein [Paenibacillus sp. IB182496]|uniref:Helix-turn-helix domain-containing protein n=1 Tax=Paenibacillus sabuli TaxID=2772509 RepID=A0A927GTH2_9BACL|nr:helix-turn-helix domain-containing protein [Paenibacillus sabuli]MBD2847095.1 helix-turn-helix domain-containing protein [Paenibacillus sabuli]